MLRSLKFALPLLLLSLIAVFLWQGLNEDPHRVPSALVGKPVPTFRAMSLLNKSRTYTDADFRGRITVLNVFASWCISCRVEHPVLIEMKKRHHINLVGLDYKDPRTEALHWLKHFGNPFNKILYDPLGKLAMDLGVYGTPETFVIDQKGIIRAKHVGAMSPEQWQAVILPVIQKLRRKNA